MLERAKLRGEIDKDADKDLIINILSGAIYYAVVFMPTTESIEVYMRRTLAILFEGIGSK